MLARGSLEFQLPSLILKKPPNVEVKSPHRRVMSTIISLSQAQEPHTSGQGDLGQQGQQADCKDCHHTLPRRVLLSSCLASSPSLLQNAMNLEWRG